MIKFDRSCWRKEGNAMASCRAEASCRTKATYHTRSYRHKLAFFTTCILVLQSAMGYANDYYEQGFSAYFAQDYEQAKLKWLQGAKQGDAKSMFNLGLLHEQGRTENPDQVKANEWFTLAGKAGYFAADYHLALRIVSNRGDQQQADDLLRNAASNGFIPAVNYLNGGDSGILDAIANSTTSAGVDVSGDEGRSRRELEKSRELKKRSELEKKAELEKKTKSRNSTDNKDYLSESWILSKKPTYWTIQLLAFSDEVKVKAFIKENQLNNKAAYFLQISNDKTLYKLIYGVYKTKIQADFARQNLSDDLAQHGPWLRSVESVQTLIKAQ